MKTISYEILKILADGEFHSGAELGKRFNITRSAIWKIIKQLSSLGIEINSVKAKGYQIPNGLELFDKKIINKNLTAATKEKITKLEIFETINSTNQYLLEQAKTDAKSGSVCLAEYQSAGRGRRGRNWHSPFGTNLYLSLLWHFYKDPAEISGLSLAIAIGIVHTLQKFGLENLQLKWPNDILWSNKKLAGILLEMLAENHGTTKVVIGVGLNLSIPNKDKNIINQPWIDLESILGKRIARNQLAATLLNEVFLVLKQFEEENLSPFLTEWQQLDITQNQEVTLHSPLETIQGKVVGITEKGELLFQQKNTDQIQKILSGEVSLRF